DAGDDSPLPHHRSGRSGQSEHRQGGRRPRRLCALFLACVRTVRAGPPQRMAAFLSAYRSLRVSPYRPAGFGGARTHAARTGRAARAVAGARARHPDQSGRNGVRLDRRRHPGRPGTGTSADCGACVRVKRNAVYESGTQGPVNIPMTNTDDRATKYIFVTGGVVSSLGKGLAAASIGCLLEGHGYKVTLQKFDPYINVDPGTMSPYQHGEVYVTDDGGETDLDLGHYERFTNTSTTRNSNWTTGKI